MLFNQTIICKQSKKHHNKHYERRYNKLVGKEIGHYKRDLSTIDCHLRTASFNKVGQREYAYDGPTGTIRGLPLVDCWHKHPLAHWGSTLSSWLRSNGDQRADICLRFTTSSLLTKTNYKQWGILTERFQHTSCTEGVKHSSPKYNHPGWPWQKHLLIKKAFFPWKMLFIQTIICKQNKIHRNKHIERRYESMPSAQSRAETCPMKKVDQGVHPMHKECALYTKLSRECSHCTKSDRECALCTK